MLASLLLFQVFNDLFLVHSAGDHQIVGALVENVGSFVFHFFSFGVAHQDFSGRVDLQFWQHIDRSFVELLPLFFIWKYVNLGFIEFCSLLFLLIK